MISRLLPKNKNSITQDSKRTCRRVPTASIPKSWAMSTTRKKVKCSIACRRKVTVPQPARQNFWTNAWWLGTSLLSSSLLTDKNSRDWWGGLHFSFGILQMMTVTPRWKNSLPWSRALRHSPFSICTILNLRSPLSALTTSTLSASGTTSGLGPDTDVSSTLGLTFGAHSSCGITRLSTSGPICSAALASSSQFLLSLSDSKTCRKMAKLCFNNLSKFRIPRWH